LHLLQDRSELNLGYLETQAMAVVLRCLLLSVIVAVAYGIAGPEVGAPACISCIHWWCPSVVGPCVVTPPPGPGAMVCMAVACGIPCTAACTVTWCFDDSTQFTTPHGEVPVSILKKGDRVLTDIRANGTYVFTEVTDVGYIEKDVEMLTLSLASGVSLTATENHAHIIAEGGRRLRKQASELEVGMVMASTRDGTNGTIIAIAKSVSPGKWSVATESCSAYANGVLTATSCSTLVKPDGEWADIGTAVRDNNTFTNPPGTKAEMLVLSVDGKRQSSDLGPAALAEALESGLSWHMKAKSLG